MKRRDTKQNTTRDMAQNTAQSTKRIWKRSLDRSTWIPMLVCFCLLISIVVPFVPGVLAEEEETAEAAAVADTREMVYPLACFTTQSAPQPPLAVNEAAVSEFFSTTVSRSVAEPTEGYAYRFPRGDSYENFFYCGRNWYYLGKGTQQTFYGISIDPLSEPEDGCFTFTVREKHFCLISTVSRS